MVGTQYIPIFSQKQTIEEDDYRYRKGWVCNK